jgi:hypothetical protein
LHRYVWSVFSGVSDKVTGKNILLTGKVHGVDWVPLLKHYDHVLKKTLAIDKEYVWGYHQFY